MCGLGKAARLPTGPVEAGDPALLRPAARPRTTRHWDVEAAKTTHTQVGSGVERERLPSGLVSRQRPQDPLKAFCMPCEVSGPRTWKEPPGLRWSRAEVSGTVWEGS